MTPAAALENATTIEAKARKVVRWPAWLWLALGVGMPVHLIGTELVPDGRAPQVIDVLPLIIAVVGMIYSLVQRATSTVLNRLVWPVTGAFVVLVLASVLLKHLVVPDGAVLAVVLVGLLPAIPCFYGVWRVLSR